MNIDIDECMANMNDSCSPFANCTNTPGSFTCTCNQGYTGDGTTCDGKSVTVLDITLTNMNNYRY